MRSRIRAATGAVYRRLRSAPMSSSAPAYTGPLDLVPSELANVALAFGPRLLTNTYSGDLFEITRFVDDVAESYAAESDGDAPVSTIDAFIAAGGTPTKTATTTMNNPTVTVNNVTSLVVGMSVAGTGIPATSIIVTVGVGTIDINPPPTASNVDITLTFSGAYRSNWNDQSGHATDMHEDTGDLECLWESNCINSRPGFRYNSGGFSEIPENVSLPNGAATVFMVTRGTPTGFDPIVVFNVDDGSNNYLYIQTGEAAYLDLRTGVNEAGGDYPEQMPGTDPYVVSAAWEYGFSLYQANGVNLTQDGSYDNGGAVGSITGPGGFECEGSTRIVELIVYKTRLSAPNIALILADIAAYYGITLP